MKSLITKIVFVCTVGFIFSTVAKSQLCGDYTTTLKVLSKNGKKISHVSIQLIPLGKDETRRKTFVRDKRNPSEYKITFLEGHILKNDYKLIVLAKGFSPFTKIIGFRHCSEQYFVIYLDAVN
jgi:hypothetical protein